MIYLSLQRDVLCLPGYTPDDKEDDGRAGGPKVQAGYETPEVEVLRNGNGHVIPAHVENTSL